MQRYVCSVSVLLHGIYLKVLVLGALRGWVQVHRRCPGLFKSQMSALLSAARELACGSIGHTAGGSGSGGGSKAAGSAPAVSMPALRVACNAYRALDAALSLYDSCLAPFTPCGREAGGSRCRGSGGGGSFADETVTRCLINSADLVFCTCAVAGRGSMRQAFRMQARPFAALVTIAAMRLPL